MNKSYKYLDAEYFTKVFSNDSSVRLKASHPKNFNDPYELFLTIDTDGVSSELLAYYQDIVGQMPELPTVCLSARPDIIPMWAHYAKECSGIVIEFNENKIRESFQEIRIEKVKYSKTPITINVHQLAYAHQTSKPRHTYLLQMAAFNAAYFTKSKYWRYELEKRFVFTEKDAIVRNDLIIVELPADCVTAIIVGPNIKPEINVKIKKLCKKANYDFYQMHIGRSSMRSFFTDLKNRSFIFNGKKLLQAENSCIDCNEPLINDAEKCHWCSVDEDQKADAAFRNPMKRLAQMGLLEDYLERVAKI